ncbi:MAG: 50S ribosomal protein L3 [Candidatus Liptonbacteria bacterium]
MMILGKKVRMTQIWQDEKVVPVTVVSVPANKVAILRTKEKDGYEAVQLKMGRIAKEFRPRGEEKLPELNVGDEVKADIFAAGDIVRVSGLTKGRGFQGVVKRHGFHGGPKTHGQKNRHRAPGSIGSTAFQRVVPGRRMAGHMGTERVTVGNLKIAEIDSENGLIMLRGAVPGARGGALEIVKVKSKASK